MKYLISSCLTGINCRYNGTSSYVKELARLVDSGLAITFCPEVLGGLPVPRTRCELVSDSHNRIHAYGIDGTDYTFSFVLGAERSLKLAKYNQISTAILKSKSPSCGCGKIYDGTFSGTLVQGNGITADIFLRSGIDVINEEQALLMLDKLKEG
ncbi:MAG TPA: DUF523 domain-containing protein [Spirochaetota bacterium]|nr:DUF523 domain-containing protein [Spirochaetota bacterium]